MNDDNQTLWQMIDSVRPPAWCIPADLVGGEPGEWVDVLRLDRLRDALTMPERLTEPEEATKRHHIWVDESPVDGWNCTCGHPGPPLKEGG